MTRCRTWIAGLCLALAGSSPAVAVDPGGPAANEPAAQLSGSVAPSPSNPMQHSSSKVATGHSTSKLSQQELVSVQQALAKAGDHMEPGAMHDQMHSKTMDGSMHAKAAATQPKAPTATTPK